jgi:hypothetical protein
MNEVYLLQICENARDVFLFIAIASFTFNIVSTILFLSNLEDQKLGLINSITKKVHRMLKRGLLISSIILTISLIALIFIP